MSNDLYRVCLIGSGNVATHIGRALHQSGCIISGVYSKNIQHAQALCSEIAGNVAVDNVSLLPEADFYIISVKDAVIGEVAKWLKSCKPDAFCIHTSGSIPLDVISKHFVQSAVVYPLQTISKNELMDFGNTPLFIEAANSDSLQRAVLLAKSLSTKIYFLDSAQRKRLHLAAVFANNFRIIALQSLMICLSRQILIHLVCNQSFNIQLINWHICRLQRRRQDRRCVGIPMC